MLDLSPLQAYSGRPFMSLPTYMPLTNADQAIFRDCFTLADNPTNSTSHKFKDKKRGFSISVFGGQTADSENMTRYFLPFNKTTLRVREGLITTTNPAIDDDAQDIVAQNFNIRHDNPSFYSELTFAPKQSLLGIGFSGYMRWNDKLWFGFSAPLIHVKNTVDMVETVSFNGRNVYTTTKGFDNQSYSDNMQDAFKAPGMLYGRIDGAQKKTRIADITLQMGYIFAQDEQHHVQWHVGCVIPTGNKPTAHYLFEPIVGNNHHFALKTGTFLSTLIKETDCRTWWANVTAESSYLFANTQTRSLDLVGKPWSRYIAIFATEAKRDAGGITNQSWGINYLTQKVRVSPHFQHAIAWQLHTTCNHGYTATLGYRTHIRMEESLKLDTGWTKGPQISNIDQSTNGVNPARGINNLHENFSEDEALYITEDDLDLHGAAHPFSVDHIVYCLFSKQKSEKYSFDGGFTYTFGSNNATPKRWNIVCGLNMNF